MGFGDMPPRQICRIVLQTLLVGAAALILRWPVRMLRYAVGYAYWAPFWFIDKLRGA
jgi:hypothetical protein